MDLAQPAAPARGHGAAGRFAGQEAIVSRTGYTGEDGAEVILPANTFIATALAVGLAAAGLGGYVKRRHNA